MAVVCGAFDETLGPTLTAGAGDGDEAGTIDGLGASLVIGLGSTDGGTSPPAFWSIRGGSKAP